MTAEDVFMRPFLREVQIKWPDIENTQAYPFNLPSISHVDKVSFFKPVTYIIGENGAGKSTLIEAIAIAMGLNPEGGTKSSQFSTHQNHSILHKYLRTVKGARRPEQWYFLRAESFYNLATYMEDIQMTASAGYGTQSLHKASHGESFMALLHNKLHGRRGFYIFDEPEAALSPNRQLSALAEIHRLVENGSQLIITTHSPILLAYPNATIFQLTDSGLHEISYEDTEHFKITRDFLTRRESMLETLLNLDEEDN